MLEALAAVEHALAGLSNAILAELEDGDVFGGNLQWADAAVDRAMTDMGKIRQWLEG